MGNKFEKVSIRTTYLRIDPHILFPSKKNLMDPLLIKNMITDFLQAASLRGLDMIFVISDWLYPGKVAKAIIKDKNIDILALPGQEVVSKEGVNIIAVNISSEIENRQSLEDILKNIKYQGGFALALTPNKSDTKYLNKIADEEWAPLGIIIYTDRSDEFSDTKLDTQYELFVASSSPNPQALLNSDANTKIKPDMLAEYVPEISHLVKSKHSGQEVA